jgi:hypothetical protein
MWLCLMYTRSSYGTNVGVTREQPIPFSHQHHVGVLEIDCRYCHTSVEHSSYAGIPATKTCMNCHSQIWVGSAMLEPVRSSYRTNEPLHWDRVYNLPGFVSPPARLTVFDRPMNPHENGEKASHSMK